MSPASGGATRRYLTRVLAIMLALVVASAVPFAAPTSATAASFPTWDQVEAARGSEQAKQTQIRSLMALIDQLQQRTQAAKDRAAAAGQSYQQAQDDLDQASAVHAKLAASTAAAREDADELGSTVGQVAAAMTRRAGNGIGAGAIIGEDDPDAFLRRLSMSSKIGEQVDGLYTRASTSAKTASALAAQAKVAKTARTKPATAAKTALNKAVAASDAAATAEQAERDNVGTMRAQLVTLRDDRLSIEQGYQSGVRARAAAAAKAAAEARARQQAAARPAPEQSAAPAPGGCNATPNGW